ncbi:hypothetical protein PHISCL_10915 [Aspergillus sclerotialis]|uniref:Uncharacterized protein n=1 Tax=Aspergillus sclerotialis TaxID=2070753 RepID=A0A3A2Z0W5_9EURO|nr:hypothetical protein PHISCL_10915 [Aspergillus sclerotialis]
MTGARGVPMMRASLSTEIALGAGMGVPPVKVSVERELRLTPRGRSQAPWVGNRLWRMPRSSRQPLSKPVPGALERTTPARSFAPGFSAA